MRAAYSGRAAAYEKTGELEKALADHNMELTYLGVEVEILTSLETPNRDKLLVETAEAYLVRSKCLKVLGRDAAAQRDRKLADDLLIKADKLAGQAAAPKIAAGSARVINSWTAPVSV